MSGFGKCWGSFAGVFGVLGTPFLSCCSYDGRVCVFLQILTSAVGLQEGEPEIVDRASGDEVDTSLIIPGGRRARKGRPQPATQYKYAQKLADSDEDSW